MFFAFIPAIILIVFYAYHLYSDETSAIEPFHGELARDEERRDESVERKSN